MEVVLLIPKNNASARSLPAAARNFERKKNLAADRGVLSKKEALEILRGKGLNMTGNITFASVNSLKAYYWANPIISFLDYDWNIILNDSHKKTLSAFFIPAKSIKKTEMHTRAISRGHAGPEMDIQIAYNDESFTDIRSKVSFAKYLVKSVRYGESVLKKADDKISTSRSLPAARNFEREKNLTMKDIIIEILQKHGGKACYEEIYNDYAIYTGKPVTSGMAGAIRNVIQCHSSDSKSFNGKEDLFHSCYGFGRGWWALREL